MARIGEDFSGVRPQHRSASIESLRFTSKRTAFRSPWQNGTAERWVGSRKRELIDHVIVLNPEHLRRLIRDYVRYCNADRVHTSLQDAPDGRAVAIRPSSRVRVVGLPRVGGLHHRYEWKEAASDLSPESIWCRGSILRTDKPLLAGTGSKMAGSSDPGERTTPLLFGGRFEM